MQSIRVSKEPEGDVLRDRAPETAQLSIVPPGAGPHATVTVMAVGPVLGSMDAEGRGNDTHLRREWCRGHRDHHAVRGIRRRGPEERTVATTARDCPQAPPGGDGTDLNLEDAPDDGCRGNAHAYPALSRGQLPGHRDEADQRRIEHEEQIASPGVRPRRDSNRSIGTCQTLGAALRDFTRALCRPFALPQ